jgi:hypothetical protein
LNGLEEFAFGLDRRRNDYLRLLKLGNVARADVAHARGNGTDQILAAVVNFCWPKEDLFE